MKMTLAQALKEKNRIVGEIASLWQIIQSENSCLETHTRCADVKAAMETVDHYTSKLIELKTKIGKANSGNLADMYALEEAKSKKAQLERLDGDEDDDVTYSKETRFVTKRTAVYNEEMILKMKKKLQLQCNALQDKLDAYNALTTIEFDSPLNK